MDKVESLFLYCLDMDLGIIKIDKSVPIPLYYQLKTELLSRIKDGSYPIGSTIPTETELSESLKLSRSTVRQAILALVSEGYLERVSSKGTFVRPPREDVNYIRSFSPFYQQMAKTGKALRTKLLTMVVQPCGDSVSRLLRIDPQEKVIRLERLRYADETPMVVMLNYLPYSKCRFVLDHDFKTESLFEVLARSADSCPTVTRTISSAISATQEFARLLNIGIGDPILNLENESRNSAGFIVDYGYARYRGDLNKFEVEATLSR